MHFSSLVGGISVAKVVSLDAVVDAVALNAVAKKLKVLAAIRINHPKVLKHHKPTWWLM